MHDNPQPASAPPDARTFAGDHALPGHRVIALTGADAVAFAQAQTMNDVAALPDGHWQWSGWLTPKGRVVALFALLRFAPDSVWLLVADADADALAASLKRFVFRSKVAIAVRNDLRVAGAFEPPLQGRAAVIGHVDGAVELDLGGEGGPRALRIRPDTGTTDPDARAPADAQWTVPTTESGPDGFDRAWRAFDLVHGWPRLAADQLDAWTPQQLSLDRLRAYSVRKGCYPGQEIVARTHFLGKAKRRLALFEGMHRLDAGRPLQAADTDNAIGTLVCGVKAGTDRFLALAVVPLDPGGSELRVDAMSVREIALQDGLAR